MDKGIKLEYFMSPLFSLILFWLLSLSGFMEDSLTTIFIVGGLFFLVLLTIGKKIRDLNGITTRRTIMFIWEARVHIFKFGMFGVLVCVLTRFLAEAPSPDFSLAKIWLIFEVPHLEKTLSAFDKLLTFNVFWVGVVIFATILIPFKALDCSAEFINGLVMQYATSVVMGSTGMLIWYAGYANPISYLSYGCTWLVLLAFWMSGVQSRAAVDRILEVYGSFGPYVRKVLGFLQNIREHNRARYMMEHLLSLGADPDIEVTSETVANLGSQYRQMVDRTKKPPKFDDVRQIIPLWDNIVVIMLQRTPPGPLRETVAFWLNQAEREILAWASVEEADLIVDHSKEIKPSKITQLTG